MLLLVSRGGRGVPLLRGRCRKSSTIKASPPRLDHDADLLIAGPVIGSAPAAAAARERSNGPRATALLSLLTSLLIVNVFLCRLSRPVMAADAAAHLPIICIRQVAPACTPTSPFPNCASIGSTVFAADAAVAVTPTPVDHSANQSAANSTLDAAPQSPLALGFLWLPYIIFTIVLYRASRLARNTVAETTSVFSVAVLGSWYLSRDTSVLMLVLQQWSCLYLCLVGVERNVEHQHVTSPLSLVPAIRLTHDTFIPVQ